MRIWLGFIAAAVLFSSDHASALIPQTNYRGTIVEKNVDRGTVTVQTEHCQWCCGGAEWDPCTYVFEAAVPNQDALDDVTVGAYVEVSALGTPGDPPTAWVSVGRLHSRTEPRLRGIYGDPQYLPYLLHGDYQLDYVNQADCDSCTGGGTQTPCKCPAVATDVTLLAEQVEVHVCTLEPGGSSVHEGDEYRITIAFHSGELHAYPTCTDTSCAGPQTISDFTVRIQAMRQQFVRGDANADGGEINISDGVYILQYLFANGPPPPCQVSADANDDGQVNLADGVYILQFLFASGQPIPPPAGGCGLDETPDELTCDSFDPCG